MLKNNQNANQQKNEQVMEIDLRKGEKRKLSLFGFKGKVALSVIVMVYVNFALLIGLLYGANADSSLIIGILVIALLGVDIAYPVILSKVIKDRKKRFLLKSNTIDGLVEFLECPNYEEKVRMEDKKITFKSDDTDIDYYSTEEDDEEESTKLVGAYEEIDFEELCLNVVKFAASKGLNTDVLSVRTFLSAINSSHLIEVNSQDLEVAKKFVDVISEYLGKKAYYSKEKSHWEKPEDILWKKLNNQIVESDVLKSLLYAHKNKNDFTFLGLADVNYSRFDEYFAQIFGFINHPNRRVLIDVAAKYDNGVDPAGRLSTPKNIWFIVFPNSDASNKVSDKTIRNLVKIEVNGSIAEPTEETIEVEKMILEQFYYSISKASDDADINEDLWKKYDEFIVEAEKIVKLNLNDKYFYGVENFATMFVIAGGEEADALDHVVNAKLLPMITNFKDLEVSEVDILIDNIENIFDTEGFVVTIKTLNKLKEN